MKHYLLSSILFILLCSTNIIAQPFTRGQAFDYQPGDEFHIVEHFIGSQGTYTIINITTRDTNFTDTSLVYIYTKTVLSVSSNMQYTGTLTTTQDTLVVVSLQNLLVQDVQQNGYTNFMVTDSTDEYSTISFDSTHSGTYLGFPYRKITQAKHFDDFSIVENNQVRWIFYQGLWNPMLERDYDYYENSNPESYFNSNYVKQLVYFKKGSITGGTAGFDLNVATNITPAYITVSSGGQLQQEIYLNYENIYCLGENIAAYRFCNLCTDTLNSATIVSSMAGQILDTLTWNGALATGQCDFVNADYTLTESGQTLSFAILSANGGNDGSVIDNDTIGHYFYHVPNPAQRPVVQYTNFLNLGIINDSYSPLNIGWYEAGVDTLIQEAFDFYPTHDGYYYSIYTIYDNSYPYTDYSSTCIFYSDTFHFLLTNLEATPTNTAFTVYPNPTQGKLFIAGLSSVATISVSDIMGREVMQTTGTIVDISQLNQGVYLLKAFSNGRVYQQRVVRN